MKSRIKKAFEEFENKIVRKFYWSDMPNKDYIKLTKDAEKLKSETLKIAKELKKEIKEREEYTQGLEKKTIEQEKETFGALDELREQINQLKQDNVKLKMQINLLKKKRVSDDCYELIRKEYVPIRKIKEILPEMIDRSLVKDGKTVTDALIEKIRKGDLE